MKKEVTSINYDLAIKLKNAGLRKIVFSLYGGHAKTHDYITQTTESFLKTLNSILLMKSLGFWIGIHFVTIRPNYKNRKIIVTFVSLISSLYK